MFCSEDIQSLFDPVVEDIIKLVGEQLAEAKKNGASAIDVTIPSLLANKILLTYALAYYSCGRIRRINVLI
jgi:hypothetical protein